jgi:hypothetical protein
MKVAVVYPSAHGAAWGLSDGLVHTLRAMGHLVLDMPQNACLPGTTSWHDCIGEINQGDLLVVSAPEYACWDPFFRGHATGETPLPPFDQIMQGIRVPKFGLYCESMEREGFTWPFRWIKEKFDHNFFPAEQDARPLGDRCHWLPFGVDTDVFYPKGTPRTLPGGWRHLAACRCTSPSRAPRGGGHSNTRPPRDSCAPAGSRCANGGGCNAPNGAQAGHGGPRGRGRCRCRRRTLAGVAGCQACQQR